ncbi:MAG: hypothetical protein GTO03_07720, partial [Planctomycetales bacterium]|nr:hypothetical protein [Planctomycetales bacterium]
EAEFVSAGSVDTNSTDVAILADTPINLWRAAEKVLAVGDGSGTPMVAGVYPGRTFDYYARPTDIVYKWENGMMT